MKNFIFISPNFPDVYYKFVKSLKERGLNVLGIGDCPYNELKDCLKENLTEYYYVYSLSDFYRVSDGVHYFKDKYGDIDYLESNNEYWLEQDARLRKDHNVLNGQRPEDMDHIKFKSKMKECFLKAGAKVARYILVSTLEASLEFVKLVGYPVFVKPDNGVGAAESYAINNENELRNFHNKNLSTTYIMEEFLEGEIVTFDGICDDDSNVLLSFNEHFPIPVADVANLDIDDFYYALPEMDKDFLDLGKRVVKSFGIRKRCFHIEFFKLSKARPGLAELGEIVAMEVNMRPPGGNTPDLLSIAMNGSFYDCYADIIAYNEIRQDLNKEKYVAISVARKDHFQYLHSEQEIINRYKESIIEQGRYNKEIALVMGDTYYFGKFNNVDEALEFKNFVSTKIS